MCLVLHLDTGHTTTQTNPHIHLGFCFTRFWHLFLHLDKDHHDVTFRDNKERFMWPWSLRLKFCTGIVHTSRCVYMRTTKYNTAALLSLRMAPWLRLSEAMLQFAKAGKLPALSPTEILPAASKKKRCNEESAEILQNQLSTPPLTDTHALWLILHSTAILMLLCAIWFHPNEAELQE